MCSADFFTAEVLTLRGLVRYMVFFVVDYATRKVKVVYISNGFCGEVMERLAIQMTDYFDGLLKGKRFFFAIRIRCIRKSLRESWKIAV